MLWLKTAPTWGLVVLLGASTLLAPMLEAQGSSLPLDGPLIAVSDATQTSIRLIDLGSDTQRTLSFGTGQQHVWGFSADGCRLLFTMSEGDALPKAYTADLDGGNVQPLVTYNDLPAEAWGVWEPQWSPSGDRVVFTLMRDTRYLELIAPQAADDPYEYRIALVDSVGGSPTFVSISGDEHSPQWSPDQTWIAYAAYEKRVPGVDANSTAVPTPVPAPGQAVPQVPLLREADLWVANPTDGAKYRLTYFDTGSISMPRWSPDGSLIGFVYSPIGNNDQFWMVANQPGSIYSQLSSQWSLVLDLTWLPDGSAMLSAARDFRGLVENRLWRIPLVGSADSDASVYLDDPGLLYADYPRFSPDGRWLALRTAYDLTLIDVQARTWRLIEGIAPGNTPPVWSPLGFMGESQCIL